MSGKIVRNLRQHIVGLSEQKLPGQTNRSDIFKQNIVAPQKAGVISPLLSIPLLPIPTSSSKSSILSQTTLPFNPQTYMGREQVSRETIFEQLLFFTGCQAGL